MNSCCSGQDMPAAASVIGKLSQLNCALYNEKSGGSGMPLALYLPRRNWAFMSP